MPFIRRKKLDELKTSAFEARTENANLLQDLIRCKAALNARDRELNEVGDFLNHLSARVPDYEGYILEYMEFEESDEGN